MDKKTAIGASIVCICGFVLFMSLAVFTVLNRDKESNGDSSTILVGKTVGFSTVSPSSVENSKDSAGNTTKAANLPEPADDEFVRVKDYIPDIRVDLRYATVENFTGEQIYTFDEAYLRYGTVKKLITVQNKLKAQGMGLKIWDAFRPVSAQFKLWEICPDSNYVSDPNKGYSSHSRGNTVDVTLVDSDGTELVMPTGFDNFTELADRDYSDVTDEFARDNALLLENIMKECGFEPYSGEWWHFSDTVEYEVSESFNP